MITLLGEHIDLVRPKRITKPLTDGAWKCKRATKVRTINLSHADKQRIANELGYNLSIRKELCNGK